MHKVKRERERVRVNGSNANKKIFRGSSTKLYVPAFTQKDFESTNLSTQDSHTGNLH